eukprot:CAMPEP_0113846942 /NCGR_PEP_ID=MMETSP0372-20130328/1589_1 /TAXON_ID=340204 /ORGANISM="Lankesteria abbotti" /LENGTH=129 /DNA_ID=CAMNT_0000816145 /DNA_START=57 /DNA_END=443 /DNA_ORIENTATION=- /assembly_acc=CAM_ASM_000359
MANSSGVLGGQSYTTTPYTTMTQVGGQYPATVNMYSSPQHASRYSGMIPQQHVQQHVQQHQYIPSTMGVSSAVGVASGMSGQRYQPANTHPVSGPVYSLNMQPIYDANVVPTYEAACSVRVSPASYANW